MYRYNAISIARRRISCSIVIMILAAFLPMVVGADCNPQFMQVNQDGFGDRFNIYAWSMKEFNGYLYVGTLNQKKGAELWRYDGDTWEQIVDAGFGNPNNTGIRNLTRFGGQLYAGVMNETEGAGVWRSADGVTWAPVIEGGFGNPGNSAVRGMFRFKRQLYVSLQAVDGSEGELWRSPNGTLWIPVALQGFGNVGSNAARLIAERGEYY